MTFGYLLLLPEVYATVPGLHVGRLAARDVPGYADLNLAKTSFISLRLPCKIPSQRIFDYRLSTRAEAFSYIWNTQKPNSSALRAAREGEAKNIPAFESVLCANCTAIDRSTAVMEEDSSRIMEEEDDDENSSPIIPDSWEATTKREQEIASAAPPPFRTRTQTEETTLAQYSKRLISRTLSGLKASGQSLSKLVLVPIEKSSSIPYTMTEDNPFVEDEQQALASSTASSTVSSISLDSARRFAIEPHTAEGEQSRMPPAEIHIRIPLSLDVTECGGIVEDWQATWVSGGTPTSADEVEPSVPVPSSPSVSQKHRCRPPMAVRSRTTIDRPKAISNKAFSPSLSRVHTDTTVTSVTTHTFRQRTTAQHDTPVLLHGIPKRSVTTGATVFSFGSRVGESSVTEPLKLAEAKSVHSKPPIWKNLTAPVKRWTAAPAKLCRSQTGCMA